MFRHTFCYTGWNGPAVLREKGKNKNMWQLQDWEKADQSVIWSLIDQMPSCLLSLPPPYVYTSRLTDAGNIQHAPLQKYRVAGEDVHLVTVAEKMQPALPVTAQFAEKARKKKPEAEKAATKHSGERKSDPCSLSAGQVMIRFVSVWFVIFMKYVRFANLAMLVARISPVLTLASLCVVFSHENG